MASTPRRSPRLAKKRTRLEAEMESPTLRKVRACFGEDEKHLFGSIQECLTSFHNLIVTYEEEKRLKRCLMIARKVKQYDSSFAPFDSVRLVVETDGSFKFHLYGFVVEEGLSLGPITCDNSILSKIDDNKNITCPGISNYSTYLSSIGYNIKRAHPVHFPNDSVQDVDCPILYQKKPKQQSNLCSCCLQLKKRLSERMRSRQSVSVPDKMKRSSASSKVPEKYLSPASKKTKMKNMRQKVVVLQDQVRKLLCTVDRYEIEEKQMQEISNLVKTIHDSEAGQNELERIFSEAEACRKGRGEMLKAVWGQDMQDLDMFYKDQEKTVGI